MDELFDDTCLAMSSSEASFKSGDLDDEPDADLQAYLATSHDNADDDDDDEGEQSSAAAPSGPTVVIKQGWCWKESGGAMGANLFGGKWQRRWFVLYSNHTINYFKAQSDKHPAGTIHLTPSHITNDLKDPKRPRAFGFTVGPQVVHAAVRIYYIAAESAAECTSWQTEIRAAIATCSDATTLPQLLTSGLDTPASWRLQCWEYLKQVIGAKTWCNHDVKNGVTIARMDFSKNGHVSVRLEGSIAVQPDICFDFLRQALDRGGACDYPFRSLREVQSTRDAPEASVLQGHFAIPTIGLRSITVVRSWLRPGTVGTSDSLFGGMLLVTLPDANASDPSSPPPSPSSAKGKGKAGKPFSISVQPSGLVLYAIPPIPDRKNQYGAHTRVVVSMTLDLGGRLQTLLKATYRTGILKIPIRHEFHRLKNLIEESVGA
ncbi:hypothetical protein CAOG_03280 [Capsaspora owczarzaki ATCC 30864]|uniref:PH domain-containing protein n=1 Tax=Capsaspora owczarzaki (strain ATCC 30864) TaxID=595528 RepID=A0A0D2WP04_CAPO3|nr:hypothetical protein CAOG_03280 [Capsaspora owczarzaki ATCC 30864]KJE92278.1 hypothetical protein CAOG_003280 [Capsaspora owczarzaki ATCC 30864]|eukprot:XP_004364119.2 hypothetical protein CAOG_03280 [Capsaspora owczarzaki ATCC 30864]